MPRRAPQSPADLFIQAGWKQYYLSSNEETDVLTFRKDRLTGGYSHDEDAWWVKAGRRSVGQGNLDQLETFLTCLELKC